MSAAFIVNLPLETVAAIQSGASDVVLGRLHNLPDGQYRLIHDVARNVFTAVNAVPYNIVPKTAPVDLEEVASTFSNLGLSAPIPAFSDVGSQDGGESTRFSPMSPQYTPASPAYSEVSTHKGPWGALNTGYVAFIIRDLMGVQMDFRMPASHSFQLVVNNYSNRIGIPASSLDFSYENGWEIRPTSYGQTLRQLGISKDTIILAKQKVAQTIRYTTITIRDLMLSEEKISIDKTATFDELVQMYAERTGYELFYRDCTILAHPKRDDVLINVVVRDAMDREEHISIRDGASPEELATLYCCSIGKSNNEDYCSLRFKFGGKVLTGGRNFEDVPTTLREIGVVDGSLVTVRPMPKTDSQEDDGVEDEPYDPFMTVTVRDALLNEQQVSVAKAGNVFNLRDAYGAASGMHDYNLAWSFNGNELDTEGWSAGPFDLEDLGITNGSVVTVGPKFREPEITVTVRDAMLDEQQVTVSEAGNLWTLLDAYGAATGADVYRLSWSFGGEALDTESPSGGTTGLVELGITTGSVVTVAPGVETTVIFRDQMLKEQRITVTDSNTFWALSRRYSVDDSSSVFYVLSTGKEIRYGSASFDESVKALGITDGSIINVHPAPKQGGETPRALPGSFSGSDFGLGPGEGWDARSRSLNMD